MKKLILLFLVLVPIQARALTLAELRVRSELLLSQDTAATTKKWSNVELKYWINSGARYISGLAECLERDTSIALVQRKWEYSLPTDFIRVGERGMFLFGKKATQAQDRSPRGLTPKDGPSFGKEANGGSEPTQYLDLGRRLKKIALTPTPATAGDSLRVTFICYDRVLSSDSDSLLMPVELQETIPMYVRFRAQKKYVLEGPYWNDFIQELQLIIPTLGPIRAEQIQSSKPGPAVTP